MRKKTKQTGKRPRRQQQRVVKPRLHDLVKAAHEAGAEISVSLEPKERPFWQINCLCADGRTIGLSVNNELAAIETVARLLNGSAACINVMRGKVA